MVVSLSRSDSLVWVRMAGWWSISLSPSSVNVRSLSLFPSVVKVRVAGWLSGGWLGGGLYLYPCIVKARVAGW